MTDLVLNFQGRTIKMSGPSSVIENLKADFELFVDIAVAPADVEMELIERPYEGAVQGRRLFKTRMCDVYGWGLKRFCDYGAGTVLFATNEGAVRRFSIFSAEPQLLHE